MSDERQPVGPAAGVVVIVLLVVVGALYFFSSLQARLHRAPLPQTQSA